MAERVCVCAISAAIPRDFLLLPEHQAARMGRKALVDAAATGGCARESAKIIITHQQKRREKGNTRWQKPGDQVVAPDDAIRLAWACKTLHVPIRFSN